MSNIDLLLQEAQQLHQRGQLVEAKTRYKQVLAESSRSIEAIQGVALCYAMQGKMTAALDYFQRALELNPSSSTLHNNIANTFKALKHHDKAIHHYQEALRIDPHYAQAHNNIAILFALQNNYQTALRHYAYAVNAEPSFTAAHYNLGLLLLQHDELTAAATQFKNVLSLQPDHLDAHFYLGILYLKENQLSDAEHEFQYVLSLDNEHVNALINLGVTALKRDQGQLAVDFFTKALAFDEENSDARNNLAATFIHHDRYENALIHYDILLKKDPKNIEYLYNSGVAQMALGHLQQATDQFTSILMRQENHFAALNNLAAIQSRLGNRSQAIDLLKRAVAVNPNDTACQFMLYALTGSQKQPAPSPEYITNLFNRYALSYENHMQTTLNYALPHQIAKQLHQLFGLKTLARTIDLGCGTGLMGIIMKGISEHLTGVDLSAKMLAAAKEKAVYDQLVESELIAFLKNDTQQYQLVIAADVIPYLGELDTFFSLIQKRLSPDGFIIFSTEISLDDPWKLQSSARFCHHESYIQSLLKKHHLKLISQEETIGRTQDKQPLNVIIYTAKNMACKSFV